MREEGKKDGGEVERAGLCSDCAHARRVESARGSVFVLCDRSASDPAYAKYPRLPMRDCPGYAPAKRGG
ncbi:MAG: hypothetical protein LAN71_06145 [Acidobacteriia bacterium]|nr:hypothetical protein [Terriglobia bacterium]